MPHSDLRRVPDNTDFECDICIVGTGPAGTTLATELAGTSLNVIVVESGGRTHEDDFSSGLNEIESIGSARVMQSRKVRNRVLGGSSHTWFGRCAPLDAIDYAVRPWVPFSGWPVSFDELAPYVKRSTSHLGLKPEMYTGGLQPGLPLADSLQGTAEPDLRVVAWQFSTRASLHNDYVRFGLRIRALKADNVRVLTHATVVEIQTADRGDRVTNLQIASPQGKLHTVRAQRFVLCGGGIENARMLLASNRRDPRGVGNHCGYVGRFFMDHPRTTAGTFAAHDAPVIQKELGLFRAPSGVRVQCGLSLSTELQRDESLLNCAAWTTQHVADDDPWRSMRSLRSGGSGKRLQAALVIGKSAHQIAADLWRKAIYGQGVTRRLAHLDLDVTVEQTPNPQSRIQLSTRRDALNVPLSQIDWKIGEQECQSVIRLSHATNAALLTAGLPQAALVNWIRERRTEDAVFSDPAHPLGATRMADSEQEGVVDSSGKVFRLDNLYIAGSSIFPTGGHANPTLTIVALALRLADHLKELSISQ